MLPASFNELVSALQKLPGISKRQAERIAHYLIDQKAGSALSAALLKAEEKIHKCAECYNWAEEGKLCAICSDKSRQKKLVIVESALDVAKFESMLTMRPYYHVLGGVVNLQRKVDINDLNVKNLKERAKTFGEVILALSPNLEGIVTANYLRQLLSGLKVTQLAQGIPLGAAMEYVDEITLKAALDNRKEMK